MDERLPHIEIAMERLRARIALLGDRLRVSQRALEDRGHQMLLAETPLADHAYRMARHELLGLRARLADLQAALGSLILEREELVEGFEPAPRPG
jgi:hypothetical protein